MKWQHDPTISFKEQTDRLILELRVWRVLKEQRKIWFLHEKTRQEMSKNRQAAIKHNDITSHRVGAIQLFSVESQNAFYIFFFFEFKNSETFKSKWKFKLKKVETLWHWWSDFILPLYNFAHFRSWWNAWLSGKWVVQKKYDSEIRLDHYFYHHFGFDLF